MQMGVHTAPQLEVATLLRAVAIRSISSRVLRKPWIPAPTAHEIGGFVLWRQ